MGEEPRALGLPAAARVFEGSVDPGKLIGFRYGQYGDCPVAPGRGVYSSGLRRGLPLNIARLHVFGPAVDWLT